MRRLAVILALLAFSLWCGAALATPSGLNNIPTAEVVGEDILVVQGFSTFGPDSGPAWFLGFKYGPAENWEVGLDDTVAGAGSAGAPTLQVKYRVPLREGAALALGAANISDDRDRHGNAFPYAVASADLGWANGHLGYSWQTDNHAWFVGVDRAVSDVLTLRADLIQTADAEESVSSLGFIRTLSRRWLVEGWASFPTAAEESTSYVVKLNYVICRD